MPCTDSLAAPSVAPVDDAARLQHGPASACRTCGSVLALACSLLLAACGSAPRPPAVPPASPAATPGPGNPARPAAPAAPAVPGAARPPAGIDAPAPRPLPGTAPAGQPAAAPEPAPSPVPRQPRYVQLPPPPAPRTLDELQVQVARRLVESHPDTSYTRRAPPRLLAIPVIEIEFNQDGSVRSTRVLRRPSTGDETIALALAAIRRAGPYGNLSRVPRPWKIVETFLFDDDLRFKPRTLDLD